MRAKFKCFSVIKYESFESVELAAVCSEDGKNAEDNEFAESTPTGTLKMKISNPKAFGFFKTGGKYYLDFSEE